MKVFVPFQLNKKAPNFEAARLRKNIKGALELNDVKYATNIADSFDIVHYVYIEPDNKLNEVLERGVSTICSALCCEDEPNASMIDYHSKDGIRTSTLKPKALKFLNKMNLVLAPTQGARDFLAENGVTAPIEILLPGVNLSRFDFSRDDEKELFYRYFGEERSKKLVVAMGEYSNNMDGINAFINAAKKCPDAIFYYIGCEDAAYKFGIKLKRIIKKTPKNVKFRSTIPEDIYRSALLNADIFMFPGYRTAGIISIEEAMAAKCQLVVRKQAVCSRMLVDEETAYIAEYSETLADIVKSFLEGKLQPTTEKAYQEISKHNLENFGKKLKTIYQKKLYDIDLRRN
ncbi:MAG TPA: glycosyltransferase [Bacilli bacterium]|nr:glycosyltransferase [Bacilli bacterium]HPS18528.1 glycosyltransferase [Bacilli bacterium]